MKKTIKRQIVEFVASKGSATRMEIIEFYVDLKNGSGFYQSNCKRPDILSYSREGIVYHPTKTNNPFRGCLSSGFNKCFEDMQISYGWTHGGIKKAWLMNEDTKEFLVKGEDGKYQAVIKE
jgi:hypothetical protein